MKIPISSLSGARLCVMDGLVQKDGRREQGGNSEGFLWVLTTPCFFFLWHKQRTHTHTQPFTRHIFSLSVRCLGAFEWGVFSLLDGGGLGDKRGAWTWYYFFCYISQQRQQQVK